MTPVSDATILAAAGRLLHGDAWQSPIARDLGVADRTVRRWLAETSPIPAGVWPDLAAALEQRAAAAAGLAEQLRARVLPAGATPPT